MTQPLTRDIKIIVRNRKAEHEYFILERIEAGIELQGSEVKSVRLGKINISDAYALVEEAQCWLLNLHISPYDLAHHDNHDPLRKRRLLLHRRQIKKLFVKSEERGLTIVPTMIYWNEKGKIKVELGIAKGKHSYDKRQAIAERDATREKQRAIRREEPD